jgi:DHA3 family macrolide efflux protein-like MFS transporter
MDSRRRSFILLMCGEVISGIGMWVALIGNLQFMGHLLASDFLKSLLLMAGIFASVLFLPTAGKWIDRYDRQKVLLYSSLARCLNPIIMFLAIAYDSIPWMVVSLVVGQMAGALYYPTVRALLPSIVEANQLLRANTIFMNIVTSARIAGTAVGGLMITWMSLSWLYAVTLIAYLTLCFFIFLIHIPARIEPSSTSSNKKVKMKFSEVFQVIQKEPAVLMGMVISGVVALFLGGFNLLVLSFGEIQASPSFMGWIYTVEGSSILIAGLFVRRVMEKTNLIKTSCLLVFIFAIAELGMSFAHNSILVLMSYALFGMTVAFFFPMVTTVFQNRLEESIQGRFFSFKEMIDRVLFQLSLLATGACLDLFGISTYMIILAMITTAAGIFAVMYGRFRTMDYKHLSKKDEFEHVQG